MTDPNPVPSTQAVFPDVSGLAAPAAVEPHKPLSAQTSVVLKRSRVTVSYPEDCTVSDMLAAQRAARKEVHLFSLYLMQRVCLFDGRRWSAGEIRSGLTGSDFMRLQGLVMKQLGDEDTPEGDSPLDPD